MLGKESRDDAVPEVLRGQVDWHKRDALGNPLLPRQLGQLGF
jgi:hypothetical protein